MKMQRVFVVRREDPVHLYYNYTKLLVVFCAEYVGAYNGVLKIAKGGKNEIPRKKFFGVNIYLEVV